MTMTSQAVKVAGRAEAQVRRPRAAGRWRGVAISACIFGVIFGYHLLLLGGHHYSNDGFLMLHAGRVLLTDGSLVFDRPLLGNRTASKYGIGASLPYVPVLALIRLVRPQAFDAGIDWSDTGDPRIWNNELILYASVLNPLIVAAAGVAAYGVSRSLGMSRRWSTALALLAGLASPLAVYAHLDFAQPLTALTIMAALAAILRSRGATDLGASLAAGLALGYGILTRFDFLVVAAPGLFGLAFLLRPAPGAPEPERRRAWVGLGILAVCALAATAIYLWLNVLKFGSPTSFGYGFGGMSLAIFAIGLAGNTISPGGGLLWYFPLSWLALPALLAMLRRVRPVGLCLAAIGAGHLVLYSLWRSWSGGVAWGPRLLVPLSPLIVVAVGWWVYRAPQAAHARRLAAFGVLAALSWLVSLNGILFDILRFFSLCNCFFDSWGTERWTIAGSSLLTGWRFPKHLTAYELLTSFDLVWLQALAGSRRAFAAIATSVLIGGVSVLGLARLLRSAAARAVA